MLGAQACLLRQAGHDVCVVAGRGKAELVPEADSRHPEVEEVTRLLAAGEPAEPRFGALRQRLVQRLRPLLADRDLVIAHNLLTMPFNLPLAVALLDCRPQILAWTHDLASADPRYAGFQRPGWPYCVLRAPQPKTTYVAVSRARRREVCRALGLSEGAVPVVPNWIETDWLWGISPATHRLAARAGLVGADPLVLVPARVTRRKRLELALGAAAQLRGRLPRLRMVISGPLGPHSADNLTYWGELRDLRAALGLKQMVSFLHEFTPSNGRHPVGRSLLAELYRLADAVLLPSESEGFGLPLLEAALSRVPAVCADLPVLRELGAGAFTFPAGGTTAEVAKALERALASRPARARSASLRRFGRETAGARLQGLIEAHLGL